MGLSNSKDCFKSSVKRVLWGIYRGLGFVVYLQDHGTQYASTVIKYRNCWKLWLGVSIRKVTLNITQVTKSHEP